MSCICQSKSWWGSISMAFDTRMLITVHRSVLLYNEIKKSKMLKCESQLFGVKAFIGLTLMCIKTL